MPDEPTSLPDVPQVTLGQPLVEVAIPLSSAVMLTAIVAQLFTNPQLRNAEAQASLRALAAELRAGLTRTQQALADAVKKSEETEREAMGQGAAAADS